MYLVKNSKSPYYQVVSIVDGRRTTCSTRTGNFREANKFLNNFRLQPKKELLPDSDSINLTKFQDEYVTYLQPTKSKSYVRSVELSFKMLIEFIDDIPLNKITLHLIDKFITHTYCRTPRSASLYYRTLKAAFSKAVLWNFILDNPFKKIKSPKVAKSFPLFISELELQLILENTQEENIKDLFTIAFYTGMRLGEITNMKWPWIDLNQNQILVQCSDSFATKNKKGRVIPFNQNLKNIFIRNYPKVFSLKKDDFVFSNLMREKYREDFITKRFKIAVRKTELNDKIHFHTLRHSFASLLIQKGVSLYVVKELLGHESLTTTQIYSHLQQQNLRDAVNLL